jgi:hypothetical protein
LDFQAVRTFAFSLGEVTEAPHFERTSLRVAGKIFATALPEGTHLNAFIDEGEVHALVTEDPAVFEELWWGKKLVGVQIDLAAAGEAVVREVVESAWRRKAPKRLLEPK